jgi:uncharacterized membrane protein
MATNPYAAPQSRVDDAAGKGLDGDFVPEGQALDAGRGWNWIIDAWHLFRAQPALWIGITIALLVFFGVLGLIPAVGQLAATIITPAIAAGLLLGLRAQDEGGEITFGHLLEGFRLPQTGRLLLLGVASVAAMLVILVAFAAVAFIGYGVSLAGGDAGVAGMGLGVLVAMLVALAVSVPIYMALWFAPSLVTFRDYGVADALKASFAACLRNILPFLVYGLMLFILAILAMIPFALGLLVLMPVFIASVYTAYRDIFHVA